MDAPGRRLLLYSAVSRPDEDRLVGLLAELGYAEVCLSRNVAHLQKQLLRYPDAVLLLLPGENCKMPAELPGLLSELDGKPVFGLFAETDSPASQILAEHCREAAFWPCSSRELEFRLGKLLSRYTLAETPQLSHFARLNILGRSPAFLQVLDRVGKIIGCDAPVYIDGETGTGKELIARAIHYLGERSEGPFIAANCGAIPDQLLENEFFGHNRGAYTDAHEARAGLIAQAEGGTLFLDEIETLSARGQVVLLRFLENMNYRPLGSKQSAQANLRVITATNESIAQMVESGAFRKDLYYRINIMHILLPPLRERRDDIKLLADHFIHNYQLQYRQPERELHPDSLEALQYYDWPGNVRELENTLHREFLLADGPLVLIPDVGAMNRERRGNRAGDRRQQGLLGLPLVNAKLRLVSEFEQRYLKSALERAKGNISAAARLAGKERRSFTRLLEKHALDRSGNKA